jgi:hypothetical protein
MCAEGVNFGEGPVYDFARCIMPDGDIYGTAGQCKVGKPIANEEDKEDKKTDTRMAKLKKAFIRKMGREMTSAEIAKAANMMKIGVPIPKGKSAEDILQQMLPKGEKVMPVKEA